MLKIQITIAIILLVWLLSTIIINDGDLIFVSVSEPIPRGSVRHKCMRTRTLRRSAFPDVDAVIGLVTEYALMHSPLWKGNAAKTYVRSPDYANDNDKFLISFYLVGL